MHEDNQFGRCGRTLLWISDHILHRASYLFLLRAQVMEEGEEGTEKKVSSRPGVGLRRRVEVGMLIGRLNMYTRLCKTYSRAGEQAQACREEVEAQSIAPKRTDESARAHDYQSSHREEEWDRQWMEAFWNSLLNPYHTDEPRSSFKLKTN